MTPIVRALFVILGCALFAGCSLPRGAALTSEVLSEQKKDDPTFQVVTVDRATMAKLASWPKPGSVGASGWIGAQRGPESQIIRSNDRVTVTIWDSQENSLLTPAGAKIVTIPEMGVSSSGTIFMPYVGNILVRGLTPPEAPAPWVTAAAALLGVGAHLANAVPDLDRDRADGSAGVVDRLGPSLATVVALGCVVIALLLVLPQLGLPWPALVAVVLVGAGVLAVGLAGRGQALFRAVVVLAVLAVAGMLLAGTAVVA